MKPFRRSAAFSLIEVITVVAVIGVLASVSYFVVGNIAGAAKEEKLNSDSMTLNRAVMAYLAAGGSLDGAESADQVVAKLRTEANTSVSNRLPGLSSSFLDPRVACRMQDQREAASGDARVYWNPSARRFEFASSGDSPGIKEFYLDDTLAESAKETEDRNRAFAYNDKPGWIWEYQERALPSPPPGPTLMATVPDSGSPAVPSTPVPVVTPLLKPQFSIPGGIYPIANFDISVGLINPNPSGVSEIYYAVDYGSWSRYSAPVTLAPGAVLSAQSVPIVPDWEGSGKIDQTYAATQILLAPQIALSGNQFNASTSIITVTLANPNPAGTSSLYYALKQPSGAYPPLTSFLPYSAPVPVSVATYPDGFQIQTYARSFNPATYQDSVPAAALTTADFFGLGLDGDILFVIDASGSMNIGFGSTTRFSRVKEETISAINTLSATQRFTVITFNSGLHWAFGGADLKLATDANKQAAVSGLASLSATGGTNYEVGLRYALNLATKPTQVIFLSDGLPNQSNYLDELNALTALGIKVNTVGIGNSSSLAPLQEMATLSGGSHRFVADPGSSGTLAPPSFSQGGNEFDHGAFPLPLTLTNPNAEPTSRIRYSINGGPVSTYTGPLSLSYNSTVTAFVDSTDPSWFPSVELSETYAVKSFTAARPEVLTSATIFTDFTPNIIVTLNDRNAPGLTNLVWWFSTAEVSTAVPYSGPFSLSAANWNTFAGESIKAVKIYARAVGAQGFVLTSGTEDTEIRNETNDFLTNLAKPAFSMPVFSPQGGDFEYTQFPLAVTLSNPNGSVGQLEVSVNGASFAPYTGPISVGYNTELTAYVKASGTGSGSYRNSPELSQTYKAKSVSLATPTMSLSSNTFQSTVKTITVTLTNPNPPAISRLVYWWEGQNPATAATYTGPITLSEANWETYQTPGKSDAKLYVRAVGTEAFVQPSASRNTTIKNSN